MLYNSISPIMLEKFNSTKHKDWNENSWFYHKLYNYDKKYYERNKDKIKAATVKYKRELLKYHYT